MGTLGERERKREYEAAAAIHLLRIHEKHGEA